MQTAPPGRSSRSASASSAHVAAAGSSCHINQTLNLGLSAHHDADGAARPQQAECFSQQRARGRRRQLVAHQAGRNKVRAGARQARRLGRRVHKSERLARPARLLCTATVTALSPFFGSHRMPSLQFASSRPVRSLSRRMREGERLPRLTEIPR